MTNLRVIWGRVAAIRGNFTIERLEQVFGEFQDKGLLFVWEHEGKRYAHWTGSDVPGRLPPPSWRVRLEKFAPPVPKQQLAEYMARFARGRAAFAAAGFRGEAAQGTRGGIENAPVDERRTGTPEGIRYGRMAGAGESGLKGGVEGSQAQDLGLDWNLNGNWDGNWNLERAGGRKCADGAGLGTEPEKSDFFDSNSNVNSNSRATASSNSKPKTQLDERATSNSTASGGSRGSVSAVSRVEESARGNESAGARVHRDPNWTEAWVERVAGRSAAASFSWNAKELALARELRVGQGPVCEPGRVRPEVLERERERQREMARRGMRSP